VLNIERINVRRLQLEKQCIHDFNLTEKEDIYKIIETLGTVQIDTVNVVKRAHHLTLWSRLGNHDDGHLYNLAYHDKRVFEGWGHAMSYMPMKDWRFFILANKERAKDYVVHKGWFSRVDPELFEAVLARIRNEGPLGSKDFEGKKSSSGWWGWKPAKRALEALFSAGFLMVTRRESFQRVFDLTERVLPSQVDLTEPTEEERVRFFINRTLGCLGALKPSDIRTYYHHWCVKLGRTGKEIQTSLDSLVAEGEVEKLKVEGLKQPYYCLMQDLTRLEEIENSFKFEGCRLFSYFDNTLWQGDRVKDLFGFERALEIYIKPEQRRFGYFTLPILYGDKFVGRLDPKLDRQKKILLIRGLWLEDGFKPDEIYQNKFEKMLEDFAAFNGADKIEYPTA
jgi:uncharacterized protein